MIYIFRVFFIYFTRKAYVQNGFLYLTKNLTKFQKSHKTKIFVRLVYGDFSFLYGLSLFFPYERELENISGSLFLAQTKNTPSFIGLLKKILLKSLSQQNSLPTKTSLLIPRLRLKPPWYPKHPRRRSGGTTLRHSTKRIPPTRRKHSGIQQNADRQRPGGTTPRYPSSRAAAKRRNHIQMTTQSKPPYPLPPFQRNTYLAIKFI